MAKVKRKKTIETVKKRRISPVVWISLGLSVLFLMIAPIIVTMESFAYWDLGNGPFIVIFMREVFLTGIWGLAFLFLGLFVSVGSLYLILTKKAYNPRGLVLPAILLTVIFLGLAYGFIGHDWDERVKDTFTYMNQGPTEKVIVLGKYEVDRDYSLSNGPTEYLYTAKTGETYTTHTIFPVDVAIGEEYKIQYLPRTKYIVGIEKAD